MESRREVYDTKSLKSVQEERGNKKGEETLFPGDLQSFGDLAVHKLSYLQRKKEEESYNCRATAMSQRMTGEERDFICIISKNLHGSNRFAPHFLSPAQSSCVWMLNGAQSEQPPPTLTLLAVPPSTPIQSHAVPKAQTSVLCLTWCLLPSTRTNKNFTPHV